MSRIPDLTLERYRLGELPRAEAERIERSLLDDDGLRNRLQALDLSDEEVRREYPSDRLARDVVTRAGGRAAHGKTGPLAAAARWAIPAAVAATLAFFVLRPHDRPPSDVLDGDRPKGASASLVIYRAAESGSQLLSDSDIARAGDVIRIGYRAAEPAYGAIVSLDGRGVVTLHLPVEGRDAVALEAGETVLLDRAFELDDAPRLERFYLITAPTPFDLTPVVEAVRRAAATGEDDPAPPSLPAPLSFVAFSLRKDTRR